MPALSAGGKKTRKNRKKGSACTELNESQCKFPCRKVRKTKNMKKYGHCRSIFSKKRSYMDMKTKRVIRATLKKLKSSASKADKKKKIAKAATKKAETLEKDAQKEESKAEGFFSSFNKTISDTLGLSSDPVKKETETEPANDIPTQSEPEATAEPEPEAESAAEPEVEPEPESAAEPEVEPEPETAAEPEVEQEPEMESEENKEEDESTQ